MNKLIENMLVKFSVGSSNWKTAMKNLQSRIRTKPPTVDLADSIIIRFGLKPSNVDEFINQMTQDMAGVKNWESLIGMIRSRIK